MENSGGREKPTTRQDQSRNHSFPIHQSSDCDFARRTLRVSARSRNFRHSLLFLVPSEIETVTRVGRAKHIDFPLTVTFDPSSCAPSIACSRVSHAISVPAGNVRDRSVTGT